MNSVENLIDRLEYTREELIIALAYESKLITQSEKALHNALKATKAAAKAASDVINSSNTKELVYLKMQSTEKKHYARLFTTLSRDAADLASQAKQESAKIFLEVKKIAESLALVLTEQEDSYFSPSSEPTG